MATKYLWFLPLSLSACLDTVPIPLEEGQGGLELSVAPLSLPGVFGACYDIQVSNSANQVVWSKGNPGSARTGVSSGDLDTLCSMQYGAPGGGLTYVGACDASDPGNATVRLFVDSLWAEAPGGGFAPLNDWVNPCTPSGGGCAIEVDCQENADTRVDFNITVMRKAQQGFFDIGVNFSDVFCSAKLDCSYDTLGEDPLELLFNPSTGVREQTAVLGLACTAGPGQNTELQVSDVVVTCGGASDGLQVDFVQNSFCLQDGNSPVVYGSAVAIDTTAGATPVVEMKGTALVSNGGSFQYQALSLTGAVSGREYFPSWPIGRKNSGATMMLLRELQLDKASFSAKPKDIFGTFASFITATKLVTAKFESGAWSVIQTLGLPAGVTDAIENGFDIQTRTILARGTRSLDPGVAFDSPLFLYRLDQTDTSSHLIYRSPEVVALPAGKGCQFELQNGLAVGFCGTRNPGYTGLDSQPITLEPSPALIDLSASTPSVVSLSLPDVTIGGVVFPGNSGTFDRTFVRAVDATHVFFGAKYKGASNTYVRLIVATSSAGSWSTAPFSDGGAPIRESWFGTREVDAQNNFSIDPGMQNGENGVFSVGIFREASPSVESRILARYDGSGLLKVWSSVTLPPSVSLQFSGAMLGAWTEGSGFMVVTRLSNGTTYVVYAGENAGTTVATALFPITGSGYTHMPALRYINGGLQLFLNNASGTSTVDVLYTFNGTIYSGSVSAPSALPDVDGKAPMLPKIVKDPTFSVALADNQFLSSPCNRTTYDSPVTVSTTQSYTSYNIRSYIASGPQDTNSAQVVRSPGHPHWGSSSQPMRMRSSSTSPNFCAIGAVGSPEVYGRSMNVDIEMGSQMTVHLYEFASPRWTWNGSAWNFNEIAISAWPVGVTGFETAFLEHPLGASGGQLRAAGMAVDVDSTKVGTDSLGPLSGLTRIQPAILRRAADSQSWSVEQVLEAPSGLRVIVDDVEPTTEAIIASQFSGDFNFTDRQFIYLKDSTSGAYDRRVEVTNPIGGSSYNCRPVGVKHGLVAARCFYDLGQDIAYKPAVISISALMASATSPSSSVAATLLPDAPTYRYYSTPNVSASGVDYPARFEDPTMLQIVDSTHIVADPRYANVNFDNMSSEPLRQLVVFTLSGGSWSSAFLDQAISGASNLGNGAVVFSSSQDNGFVTGHVRPVFLMNSEYGIFATYEGGTYRRWRGITLTSGGSTPEMERPTAAWRVTTGSGTRRVGLVHQNLAVGGVTTPHLLLVELPTASLDSPVVELARVELPSQMTSPSMWALQQKTGLQFSALMRQGDGYTGTDSAMYGVFPITLSETGSVLSGSFGTIGYTSTPDQSNIPFADASLSPDLSDDPLNPFGCALFITMDYAGQDNETLDKGYTTALSGLSSNSASPSGRTSLPRDPAAVFSDSPFMNSLTVSVSGSQVTSVLPPNIAPGNAWSTDPDTRDAVWQYAVYAGNEQLTCNGQPCNKRYWNVAVGFDPSALNCSIKYIASAGVTGDFDASGKATAVGKWPVIYYDAKLTGAGGTNNLVCRQNPLDAPSSNVSTIYASTDSLRLCYRFDGSYSGGRPVLSKLAGCEKSTL